MKKYGKISKYLSLTVMSLFSTVNLTSIATAGPMEDAKALLATHQELPTFTPPGEAFDAKACMAGKKVMSIPISMTIPYSVELQKGMAEAAKEVGFSFTTWDNQLKIDQWIQGISQAVSEKYDVIDLAGGVNPDLLGPQLAEARAANVKVTTTRLYDLTQAGASSVDASSKIDFTTAGKILASWAYVKTEGKPNVLVINSSDVLSSEPYVKSITEQLKIYCPECKQQVIDVPVSEWATRIQTSVQSAILADPSINYVLPIFDSMSQFIQPALRITQTEDDVSIASLNGTPFVLDMIRDGQVSMDIGESLAWAGYLAIDNIMRIICEVPKSPNSVGPLYIFSKDNIETAGVPATYKDGYGDAYLSGFRKLWGLE